MGLTTGVPITILWRLKFALGLNLALHVGKPNGFGGVLRAPLAIFYAWKKILASLKY